MAEYNVVDQSWELIDPNPNIHTLFTQFNDLFFRGQLGSVYVVWSERMTLCAGVCRYHKKNRECSIHLSKPLLSFRPRKDLVETLLHEMIHAYLFIADGDREHESHGPKFHEHMYRINRLTGANITVYHSFNDEVRHFQTHWWKCDGPCQTRAPYFGIVKRSMNRAPGPSDFWYQDHERTCGGKFTKIKEPSPKKKVTKAKKDGLKSIDVGEGKGTSKITSFFTPSDTASQTPTKSFPSGSKPSATITSSSSSATPGGARAGSFSGFGNFLGSNPTTSPAGRTTASPTGTDLNGLNGVGTSANKSSSSSSAGHKLGGSSQNMRRGDHPLLAKLFCSQTQSSSMGASPKPALKRKINTGQERLRTPSSFGNWSEPAGETSSHQRPVRKLDASRKRKPSVEVIQLD